jgi:glycerol-3-phosphate dehydrogenase subunit B
MPVKTPYDVVVVGLGLAGLVAGVAAAQAGARTLVIGKGYGTSQFRSGCVDVLGYSGDRRVESPRAELSDFIANRAGHPYTILGQALEQGLDIVRRAMQAAGVPMVGDLDSNHLVLTAAGTLRPSCLVQSGMRFDGKSASVAAIGLREFRDFHPQLLATVLPAVAAERGLDVDARAVSVDFADLHRRHLDSVELARLFDQPSYRGRLAAPLRGHLDGATMAVFPAVLGLEDPAACAADLESKLGLPVVEAATLPPSVPGLRLRNALERALKTAGGRTWVGSWVRALGSGSRVDAIQVVSETSPVQIPIDRLVLASGGLASGGIRITLDGKVEETVAGLEVTLPTGKAEEWFGRSLLDESGQPIASMGVRVDSALRPIRSDGEVIYENVRVTGGLLAGADRGAEKSADGIACSSGMLAGRAA